MLERKQRILFPLKIIHTICETSGEGGGGGGLLRPAPTFKMYTFKTIKAITTKLGEFF